MTIEDVFTSVPVLETKHYILRGITENDAGGMLSFLSDKNTMKYITPDPVKVEADVVDEIRIQLENYATRKEIPWVIVDKSNGALIGKFSLHRLSIWHKKAELGVVVRKESQQKGVTNEILEKILTFGFETLELNRIVGDIFSDNQGSEKLLQRHGFRKEGIMRQTDFDGYHYHDTVIFSLLKLEYDALQLRR